MRAEDAAYCGGMSAHHYFRDFAYCEFVMLPWLLVVALVSRHRGRVGGSRELRTSAFLCNEGINRRMADVDAVLKRISALYTSQALPHDAVDGLFLEFDAWRFNLRKSNTESLLRLNEETRADEKILHDKTQELMRKISSGRGA